LKKAFISSLIMTLMVVNISLANTSSVQAATTDNTGAISTNNNSTAATDNTIKVSLDNIRDIVNGNNLDVKNYVNSKEIAQKEYDDAKTAYNTANTAVTSANDAITSANAAITAAGNDPSAKTTAEADLATANADLATAKINVTATDATLSTKKDALRTATDNYDTGVETKVSAAQGLYLTYLYDLSTQKINEDTVKTNEKAAQVYKLQYESGFISKNTYTDDLQANTSVNDSSASKDTTELDRTKLCNALGINPEQNITFNTDINQDFEIISKIKYEDDLKQMLDNNIAIKNQNRTISDLEDQESDYSNKDESEIYNYKLEIESNTLQQLINTKETAFKDQYNVLMKSYNAIKSSYDVILQKQKEYQVTQIQYDYGFISKNGVDAKDALDTVKLNLDNENATFTKNRNDCYLKYLQYIEMKEGY